MKIEEIMNRFPATCGPDETLGEIEQKMQNSNCAFLPVTAGDESQCLVGIITDGDISMASRLGGRSLEEFRVRDAMAKEVRTCSPDASLVKAEAIMRQAGIRCLPVVDRSGRLVGVLSLASVVQQLDQEREELSSQIAAARVGVALSRLHEPRRPAWPGKVAGPARVRHSSSARNGTAG